jgi:mannose/cellobiose epimerase-like protein (N-acyl-D-glucosamine 2-epimerase family)
VTAQTVGTGPWLRTEEDRLLAFGARSRLATGGFGWLDEQGRTLPGRPVETMGTARMTYVFALARLRGRPGAAELADHGVATLHGLLRDAQFGGWFPADPASGEQDEKRCYDHAFVVLAAAAATVAGVPDSGALLADALSCVEQRFWWEADGLAVDRWDRAWTTVEPYRGANANMHLVEAFLTAFEATGDPRWRDRALGIAERLIHGHIDAVVDPAIPLLPPGQSYEKIQPMYQDLTAEDSELAQRAAAYLRRERANEGYDDPR